MKKSFLRDELNLSNKSDSINPDVESWVKLIDQFLFNGNYERARYFLHVALDMHPESEKLWILSGDLYAKLKEFDDANSSEFFSLQISIQSPRYNGNPFDTSQI